ncbi:MULTISPECIES: hypothetical protein [unclassified Leifsonia]|uniref:hypothetical protein n=1 Tax=unclassified Leifsonia TaxID=2663824 RepID=UPI0006F8C929|nr:MULTISPECIES: hypothetical protein [unclassified Leifsonia]KQX06534.1 hypothetical protein ASC59_01335 [Leifsonia sp. Root1293]KRA10817.1 hypothetical protein ASD61_01335 [Leifsonia sp. Root60]
MNPLILWSTRDVRILDHSNDDESLRHQQLRDAAELEPLERDGRWAAAIHRWAMQDEAAALADQADAAHEATRARHSAQLRPRVSGS